MERNRGSRIHWLYRARKGLSQQNGLKLGLDRSSPIPGVVRSVQFHRLWVLALLGVGLLGGLLSPTPTQALDATYCQFSGGEISEKDQLRQLAIGAGGATQQRYQKLLKEHAEKLQRCRRNTWPQNQAIWLRLYACDLEPGRLEEVLDRIVNRGYNEVYVEVFYDGQVLLPMGNNPTAWPSVIRTPGTENADLLAMALQKGRERGLKVYAWMFSMNFGYIYAQRPDRQQVLARNGQGQISLQIEGNRDQGFVDPYHPQARADYLQMVQAIVQRRPDGLLFDYIRYPRGTGSSSIASKVKDLWIYGIASQQAFLQRALNQQGQFLIQHFLQKGYVTIADIRAASSTYPQEPTPLWQGRNPAPIKADAPSQAQIQQELWTLSVAHAAQGVIDFLTAAMQPAQQMGIPTGSVFFPSGNQVIGQGYDSRLQPWERFPTREWHPMSYSLCGSTQCIVEEVQRVLSFLSPGFEVKPVLAGLWGQTQENRPSLEAQMQAIRQVAPQINSISHFAYSWQDPSSDRDRRFCRK